MPTAWLMLVASVNTVCSASDADYSAHFSPPYGPGDAVITLCCLTSSPVWAPGL